MIIHLLKLQLHSRVHYEALFHDRMQAVATHLAALHADLQAAERYVAVARLFEQPHRPFVDFDAESQTLRAIEDLQRQVAQLRNDLEYLPSAIRRDNGHQRSPARSPHTKKMPLPTAVARIIEIAPVAGATLFAAHACTLVAAHAGEYAADLQQAARYVRDGLFEYAHALCRTTYEATPPGDLRAAVAEAQLTVLLAKNERNHVMPTGDAARFAAYACARLQGWTRQPEHQPVHAALDWTGITPVEDMETTV